MVRGPVPKNPALDDDVALIHGCLNGDASSWSTLISSYAAYIYAIARRAFGFDETVAAEVFQETCIRLYFGLRTYRGSTGLRPWIRAVAVSACREHLRQAARHAHDPLDDSASEPGVMEDVERALDVREAVAALGEPCRTTVEMYFFEDLTQAEVAERLAVPAGTVAARLSRCLERMRRLLQESGAEPPSRMT